MLDITAEQRRALRARAHALDPVVAISQHGLSSSVLQEISSSLASHELIKIRVFSDQRETREQYLSAICEELGAAPVQHIGKLLVVWRPNPEQAVNGVKGRTGVGRRAEPRRSKRSLQGNTPR